MLVIVKDINLERALALSLTLVLTTSCASAPASPAELVTSCEPLLSSAPQGTTVPQADMPRLLNGDAVHRRLTRLYTRDTSRRAVLQLLVQPDGTVSHGCVRMPSGESQFDRAALRSAEMARFRPGQLNGEAVEAWVTLPISVGM